MSSGDGDNFERITPEVIEQAADNVLKRRRQRSEFRESLTYHRWYTNLALVFFAGATFTSAGCVLATYKAQVQGQDPLGWVLATAEVSAGFLLVFIVLRLLVRREERKINEQPT